MEILFKTSNTGNLPATVGHSNFQEHYGGVNVQTSWAGLVPSIKTATKEHLIPAIGQELYDAIVDDYHNAPGGITGERLTFLEGCQEVIALFSMLYVAPEMNINFSNMGAVEKGSSQGPVMPVAQWRYKDFKYDLAKRADRALDRLIALLEKYTAEDIAFFMSWTTSEVYAEVRTSFFSSADQFNKYVKIGKSRRMFASLYPGIIHAEEKVDQLICEDQFNALVDAIKNDDATDPEKVLLERIRRYVAAAAIAQQVPGLCVTLDTHGLQMSSYTDGMDNKAHPGSMFRGAEMVGAFVRRMEQDADTYFREMVGYIHLKIDDYPLIKDSDCYAGYKPSGSGPICSGDGAIFL